MAPAFQRVRVAVLGVPIDVVAPSEARDRIAAWAAKRDSRVVTICNAHAVVTANCDPDFRTVIEQADMATPDGMPVAWMLRALGHPGQKRVDGPDLMWEFCRDAAQRGDALFLYGSTVETLLRLSSRLREAFPALHIAGSHSPPFRDLTIDEDEAIVRRINDSGAQVIFVGLGCPRQELWMHAHRDRIHAVMIGVGAAFDFHAGVIRRAPRWMRTHGLEWLHRLISEPRRLWHRYLVTNSAFIFGAARQLIARRQR